jgi:hypothetical protein
MARLLPDPIVGSFPPAVLKVARALKAVPGEALTVWMGLPLPNVADRPDFLAVYEGTSAFVISVCPVTRAELDEAINGSLFSAAKPLTDSASLGGDERTRVRQFIRTALRLEPSDDVGPPSVYGWVLFPNVSHATLESVFPANPSNGCYWLGQEYCTPENLALCVQKPNTGMLEERQLALLRSHFTPEAVVPRSFSARRRVQRQVAAELAPLLLDFDQEAWAKNRLKLSPEAAAVAEDQARYGQPSGDAALVTGVAGSGKSLVLLFRACTQARLDPQCRSLVLTHNRALRGELARRFGELGKPANVVWHTFFSWVSETLGGAHVGPRIVQYRERDEMIADAARACGETVTASWVEFLRDEFDWMQDRDVTTLDRYRTIDRVGRRVRLTAEQRIRVHQVYCQYVDNLQRAHAEDWSGRALRFWRQVERGTLQLKTFDYIYIDEAQFFAPVWLKTLQHALAPDGRLLLAADPTQGFLKRRQSWTACGLDLRGRSTRLRRSYRNTREILEFAGNFYRSRLAEDDDTDINLPEDAELATAESGPAPKVIQLSSRQDELTRVANEVAEYLQGGGDPDTLLILIATSQRLHAVREALAAKIGADQIVDAKETASPGKIRLCSLDAATGLEAPVVFLVGAAELLEREGDLQLATEQREELIRDNTRRLYMAFTRAGLRLVITWTGQNCIVDQLNNRPWASQR